MAEKDGASSSESDPAGRPIYYFTLDNLGEVTQTDQYNGDGITVTTRGGVPVAPSSSLLFARQTNGYDEIGQVYQTTVYPVTAGTGAVGTYGLSTGYYRDSRGNVIETINPGGEVDKSAFDGADRDIADYVTDGAGGTSYASASSVTADHVVNQIVTTYDSDSNPILTANYDRFSNATSTGALTSSDSRISYDAEFFDAADRETADENVGTNGGSTWSRPSTPDASDDTHLVTSYGYAGDNVQTVTLRGAPTGGSFTLSFDAWNQIATFINPATNQKTIYSDNALGQQVTTDLTARTDLGPVLVVNNGSAQRSMVDSLTVIFPSVVTLSAGAFTLNNTTGSYAESISWSNPSGDGRTWLIAFTGTDIVGGSLPTAIFGLTVHAADVSGITLSSDVTWAFHRLFGDYNGDGTVNAADNGAFVLALTDYDPAFDYNDDGAVNGADNGAFKYYLGTTLTYTQTGAPFVTAPAFGSTIAADCSPWANVTNDLYYSVQGQVLETWANGAVASQNVWGLDYVNDLVLRDDSSTSGSLGVSGSGLGQRLYAQHDANYDVTALTDASGAVVARYQYDPYGNVTVLNPDGTVRGDGTLSSSSFGMLDLFQGMRYDPTMGLYQSETRNLNPATGTWMQADPARYIDGTSMYQGFDSNPTTMSDPAGLQAATTQQSAQESGPAAPIQPINPVKPPPAGTPAPTTRPQTAPTDDLPSGKPLPDAIKNPPGGSIKGPSISGPRKPGGGALTPFQLQQIKTACDSDLAAAQQALAKAPNNPKLLQAVKDAQNVSAALATEIADRQPPTTRPTTRPATTRPSNASH